MKIKGAHRCGYCRYPMLQLWFPYPIGDMYGVEFCINCDGNLAEHERPDDLIANYHDAWRARGGRNGDNEQ